MSSVQLLDKTRKIGKLLHNNNSSKVVFSDICKVMREILNSNVLVISRKGKVLGVGKSDGIEPITELLDDSIGGFIDPMLNERLLGVLSTKENVNLETLGFIPVFSGYHSLTCSAINLFQIHEKSQICAEKAEWAEKKK